MEIKFINEESEEELDDIESTSDQLFLFMRDIDNAIYQMSKDRPELSYDQCLKLAEVATLNMHNDILLKGLDKITKKLNKIYESI